MRTPYWLQGMLFAPALVGLLFMLKATCPAPTGAGCFSDPFLKPLFLPIVFLYRKFGETTYLVSHEAVLILIYWGLIGFLLGFIFDLKD